MEAKSEQERFESGALSHDSLMFTPEQAAIRGLVDAIGSVVVLDEQVIEVAA